MVRKGEGVLWRGSLSHESSDCGHTPLRKRRQLSGSAGSVCVGETGQERKKVSNGGPRELC